jgi:hypothetical protein
VNNKSAVGNVSVPQWVPAPKDLKGFPEAKRAKPKTFFNAKMMRKRWKDDDGRIYEWDYRHGTVECMIPVAGTSVSSTQ